MILAQFIEYNINLLKIAGCDAPRTDVLAILEQILGKNKAWILAHDDHKLSEEDMNKLNNLIKKRTNREPLAYILGNKEFYGREFIVNKSVLIPRPESEDIVDIAKSLNVNTFIDVGTGSGCLATTIALETKNKKRIVAIDIDESALKIATNNASKSDAKVDFFKSDLIDNVPIDLLLNACLLVNLPYVPENLITSPEITQEPNIALFSGKNGMELYRKFWQQIQKLKYSPNYIITESLISQHASMENLANKCQFKLVNTKGLAQLFEA